METDEIKQALKVAADALDIADDHGITNIQVNPLPEWGLRAYGEDTTDGWCSASELAKKLREISERMDEISYEVAYRRAWRSILWTASRRLGHDDLVAGKAAWIIERGEIIDRLRSVCTDFGDNDWPDELNLGDAVDKYLANYLWDKKNE